MNCDCCTDNEQSARPVLVDDNYETWLCSGCVRKVRREVTVTYLDDETF